MTPIEMIYQIMTDQGVVAGLLIILIFELKSMMHDQTTLTREILKKNCEMNRFLMTCLEREINEDHPNQDSNHPNN
jgi:hypothetical protein